MFHLPPEFSSIISVFSVCFSKKIFERGSLLLLGSILTRGKRTVCSVLRTLGLSQIRNWDLYHRVLSRAKWSPLKCSGYLLSLLLKRFVASDRLVFGMDDTLERRWGSKIGARGFYYDSVRSTKKRPVSSSGLRWICVMLLSEISWTGRLCALPFLSVLTPSLDYYQAKGKRHKTLTDWARQICLLLHRWLPDYEIIMLGDGAYAARELFKATSSYVSWITRFRWDGRLHDFPPARRKGQMGCTPKKGKRQMSLKARLNCPKSQWQKVRLSKWYEEVDKPMEILSGKALWYRAGKALIPIRWLIIRDPEGKLDPVALQATNLELEPLEILRLYLMRWQVEVTFQECRAQNSKTMG